MAKEWMMFTFADRYRGCPSKNRKESSQHPVTSLSAARLRRRISGAIALRQEFLVGRFVYSPEELLRYLERPSRDKRRQLTENVHKYKEEKAFQWGLRGMEKRYIGVDLGGTNIQIGVVDPSGNLLCERPTGRKGTDAVIGRIVLRPGKRRRRRAPPGIRLPASGWACPAF